MGSGAPVVVEGTVVVDVGVRAGSSLRREEKYAAVAAAPATAPAAMATVTFDIGFVIILR